MIKGHFHMNEETLYMPFLNRSLFVCGSRHRSLSYVRTLEADDSVQ